MKKMALLAAGLMLSWNALAANYLIDTKNVHAFILFKISHLGFSIVVGRFDKFTGEFTYDPHKLEASTVSVIVDTASLDTNQAERDKHLKSDEFLDVKKYPTATFVSTRVKSLGGSIMRIIGKLTLHGVTRSIVIDATKVGEGKDPWGGYRAGFSGTTRLRLKDFNIPERLGPASREVDLEFYIEGVRQHDSMSGKSGNLTGKSDPQPVNSQPVKVSR